MFEDHALLIVGGTARNVGKTELVCRIIEKICAQYPVYALKVSAIFPDEGIFHGNHSAETEDSCLFEETRTDTAKDTSRMLRAGARRVFYLRSDDSGILEAFSRFRRQVPPDAAIICESNSLAEYVHPGLQIMVTSTDGEIKARAVPRLQQADLIIASNGSSGFAELKGIHYNPAQHWYLSSPFKI